MELDEEMYKWLVAMKVMPNDGFLLVDSGKRIDKGKVKTSANSSIQLQNGSMLGKLIRTILRNQKQASPSALDHMKEGATPAVKTANWNIVWNCFALLRMDFDQQIKELIISGDNGMVVEVIKQLMEKYPTDTSKIEVPTEKALDPGLSKSEIRSQDRKKAATADPRLKQPKNQALDMTKLDQKKDPATAESSLEFLLLLLSQTLNLPPNEVLGLFTNQNKYLAHVIAKGLKGEFSQIISFYQELQKYIAKLKTMFESDPKSQGFTLYALKPGLVSKNKEVVLETINLFKQLEIYDWFVGQGKCLLTFVLGVKRHPQLSQNFVDLLVCITRDRFAEFISQHYKNQFQNVSELLSTSADLLQGLSDSEVREQLDSSGVVNEWISIALKNLQTEDKQKITTRLICLNFITKLWVAMPQYIEEDEQTYDRLLLTMKKDWSTKSLNEFVSLVSQMINLLVALANQKNPAAKLIYNLLSIVMAQTLALQDHRMFMVQNILSVCKQYPNIPLSGLLQNYSLVPALQVFDLEFLNSMADSQNIDVKSATIICQVAIKFFQESIVNSPCSGIVLKLVNKFHHDMVDFVGKSVKSLLALLYATEKNKKSNIEKPQPMYNGRKAVPGPKPPSTNELEVEIIAAQQRALIIEFIKKLLMQNNEEVTEKIRPYIVATSMQIKQFNKQGNKGINGILSMIGKKGDEQEMMDSRDRRASESSRLIGEDSQVIRESQRTKMMSKIIRPRYMEKPSKVQAIEAYEKQQEKEQQVEKFKKMEEDKKREKAKKEVEKVKFMMGFSGQAQLSEEGFWQKTLEKKSNDIEVLEFDLLEPRDVQFIDIILKKYHKVMRQLFLKYTTTGFTTKNPVSFDQQAQRTQTISHIELIKLLKDYKLFFLTDLNEVQALVRDVNIKILKKRETQQFDFSGFQQCMIQFALVVFSRPHTVNIKTNGKLVSQKRQLRNMMPAQILEIFFKYLRTITQERGESTVLFDDPDSAYFNESEVIKQFNQKLQADPNFILPEGYKKVTDRNMTFEPKLSNKLTTSINQKYAVCVEVLDEIMFNCLGIHAIQLISSKTVKCKARPNVFINVNSKLMDRTDKGSLEKSAIESANRMRDLISSAGDPKPHHSEKMMEKKTLSLGMKLGLSQVSYKNKLLGQQVAYIIDDMLTAVEEGRTTIEKPKVINEAMRLRQKMQEDERRQEEIRKKKLEQRRKQLSQLQSTTKQVSPKQKEDEERKKKEAAKLQKRQQEMEKYLAEQKAKLVAKKKEEEEKAKKKEEEENAKMKQKKEQAKKKFQQFNQNQIGKFQNGFKAKEETANKEGSIEKKKEQLQQEKRKKLRQKIHSEDQKIIQAKQKMHEQLNELYNSPAVQEVFSKNKDILKALFDFLLKSTFLSLTERKHNNEVIFETWHFFCLGFKLIPAILSPKQITFIFNSLTKNKHQTKEYYVGLDYQEFCQALLRLAVKHKKIFNQFAARIKSDGLQGSDVNEVLKAEGNQFEEPKEIDLNELLKEEDPPNVKIYDSYGDISKADENTLRGLISYLKLPEGKNKLQLRFRNVLEEMNKRKKTKKQELKEKLNEDMSTLNQTKKRKSKAQPDEPKQAQEEADNS